jgi:uncharacterized repeat protein (TIGR03803 family)
LTLGNDGNFYGTGTDGGSVGAGVVFKLTPEGALTTLSSFNNTNGSNPLGGLVQGSDGTLYGTTAFGGANLSLPLGTIFKVTTNGVLTTLFNFHFTDGSEPTSKLIFGPDGNLYGTTRFGGFAGGNPSGAGLGTAFRITTNGVLTPFIIFHGTNGSNPQAPLALGPDGNLYGSTPNGGPGGGGTIFRINLDEAPSFTSNPFTVAAANAGQPYSASITTQATAHVANAFTFAKVSGPIWLNVAANGMLSGTPADSDVGTNMFLISVTDSAGLSDTATMFLKVNGAPSFTSDPFTEPAVNVGQRYAASLDGQAVDPNPGDSLSFAKVSGPAWLSVSDTGALSGTPSKADAGSDTFVLSVTDSGGLSNTAMLFITVHGIPGFSTDPFAEPAATVGQPYAATIATNATSPNAGDTLTFAKVSGPAWLNVSTNGTLSGIPGRTDTGTNTFVVGVTSEANLSGIATMMISVASLVSPPINLQISFQGGQILLSWTGGAAPFQVQTASDLANARWVNFGAPQTNSTLVLSSTNTAAFFRIQSQ